MKTFIQHDLAVAYRDVGHGPPILMLHNGGTSSAIWREQRDALSDRYRVLAVDLPGFGASPRPPEPATLPRMVDLLAAFITTHDLAPTLVVGNCMGSNIAVSLAASHPGLVSGVLAINPLTEASFGAGRIGFLHRIDEIAPAPARFLRSLARRIRPRRPVAVATLRFQLGDKGVAKGLQRDPELLASQVRADQLPALVDVLEDMAAYGVLDEHGVSTGIPVWIAWGEQNRILSPDRSRHLEVRLEAERVETLPGCGHLPMLEDPDAVTTLIEELEARVAAGPLGATNPNRT